MYVLCEVLQQVIGRQMAREVARWDGDVGTSGGGVPATAALARRGALAQLLFHGSMWFHSWNADTFSSAECGNKLPIQAIVGSSPC